MSAPLSLPGRIRLVESPPARHRSFAVETEALLLAALAGVMLTLENVLLVLLVRHPPFPWMSTLVRVATKVGGAILQQWGGDLLLGLTALALFLSLSLLLVGRRMPAPEVER